MADFSQHCAVITVPRLVTTELVRVNVANAPEDSPEEKARLAHLGEWLAGERARRAADEIQRVEQLRRLSGRTPHEL